MSLICPSRSATTVTINSVALPKVMLSRPPRDIPTVLASSSVAKLSIEASGISAKKFVTNTVVDDHPRQPERIAKGRNMRRTLIYAWQKTALMSLLKTDRTRSFPRSGLVSRASLSSAGIILSWRLRGCPRPQELMQAWLACLIIQPYIITCYVRQSGHNDMRHINQ